MNVRAAITYLAPPAESFWRWSADGQALEWADGATIAFAQEVYAVLDRLAPHGLPNFGAVVMLLAASRNAWSASAHDRTLLIAYARAMSQPRGVKAGAATALAAIADRIERQTAAVIEKLDTVAKLPADVRTPVAAKAFLAEAVFEQSQQVLREADARTVVKFL